MGKYKYLKVIQQHFGQGWEDVSDYETDSQGNPTEKHTYTDGRKTSLLNHDLHEYRRTGYATRVIRRREAKTPLKA